MIFKICLYRFLFILQIDVNVMEIQIMEDGNTNNGNRFLKRVYDFYVGLGNIRLRLRFTKIINRCVLLCKCSVLQLLQLYGGCRVNSWKSHFQPFGWKRHADTTFKMASISDCAGRGSKCA